MSETLRFRLSWLFVLLALGAAVTLMGEVTTAGASDDHDVARELRDSGDILPLSDLLARTGLAGQRVIEAELERENGRLVYELELLDQDGRIRERYFDAVTGKPVGEAAED
ncbi:MAG: PepSY domain-containing protein [Pseudomonadota bacterium]